MMTEKLQKDQFKFCLIGKQSKMPFEQKWQSENNYQYDDDRLKQHIENNGNYGAIGGYGGLLIVDFDNLEFQNKFMPLLPETFTVKTGSGGIHLYYIADDPASFKILDRDKNTLADIQGRGKQVVAPGSTHPNGNRYSVEKDVPIANIKLDTLKILFADYVKPKDSFKKEYDGNSVVQKIKDRVSITSVLSNYNYDLSKNPTSCGLGHSSKGGKCFSYNDNNNLWYCHHCDEGGDVFNLVMLQERCDFRKAKTILMDIAGIKATNYDRNSKKAMTVEEVRQKILDITLNEEIKDKDSKISEIVVDYVLETEEIYTLRHDEKPEMWVYSNGIYTSEGRTYIKEICRDILSKKYSSYKVGRIVSKIEADTFISAEDFFVGCDPRYIAVENGILDLIERKLMPFSKEYKFFSKLPIIFDQKKKCFNVIDFFNSVLRDESDINTIQELFGYLLYRKYNIEKAIMFTGRGRNGKSKTIELMKNFIGQKNCVNIPIQSIEKDQFAMGELFNKMANLCADISKTALNETGKFKSLTGGDWVTAPRKFLPSVHFQNYAKFIFSANELPVTWDITDAFFRRWLIIDFPFTFVSEKEYNMLEESKRINVKKADTSIISKITQKEELSGLLNWALDGFDRIMSKEDFSYNKSNIEVKNTWLRRSSSIHAFIMDCVKRKSDALVPKQEFLELYLDYCSKHKINSVPEKLIKNALETTIGSTECRSFINEERVYCWKGIIIE